MAFLAKMVHGGMILIGTTPFAVVANLPLFALNAEVVPFLYGVVV